MPSLHLVCLHRTHPCLRIDLKLSLFLFISSPFSPCLSYLLRSSAFPWDDTATLACHSLLTLACPCLPACACPPARAHPLALALVPIKGTHVLKRQPIPVTTAGYPYPCWCLSILVLQGDHQVKCFYMPKAAAWAKPSRIQAVVDDFGPAWDLRKPKPLGPSQSRGFQAKPGRNITMSH